MLVPESKKDKKNSKGKEWQYKEIRENLGIDQKWVFKLRSDKEYNLMINNANLYLGF